MDYETVFDNYIKSFDGWSWRNVYKASPQGAVAKFGAGDLVRLKSGGPVMTVRAVSVWNAENVNVECDWFDGVSLRAETFKQQTLQANSD